MYIISKQKNGKNIEKPEKIKDLIETWLRVWEIYKVDPWIYDEWINSTTLILYYNNDITIQVKKKVNMPNIGGKGK